MLYLISKVGYFSNVYLLNISPVVQTVHVYTFLIYLLHDNLLDLSALFAPYIINILLYLIQMFLNLISNFTSLR